jgi:hypothetical protein
MLVTLSVPYVANVKNTNAILSFFVAGLAVLVCEKISKATKIKIINDFSLPIALIIGMAAVILKTSLA